jgi:hypothetical protein
LASKLATSAMHFEKSSLKIQYEYHMNIKSAEFDADFETVAKVAKSFY